MKHIIGFKKEFVPLVKNGSKKTTIRKNRTIQIKSNDTLVFYENFKQKNMNKIGEAKAKSISPVLISTRANSLLIFISGKLLNREDAALLAENDGFKDLPSFYNFFKETYGVDDFNGILIKW